MWSSHTVQVRLTPIRHKRMFRGLFNHFPSALHRVLYGCLHAFLPFCRIPRRLSPTINVGCAYKLKQGSQEYTWHPDIQSTAQCCTTPQDNLARIHSLEGGSQCPPSYHFLEAAEQITNGHTGYNLPSPILFHVAMSFPPSCKMVLI